MIGANEGDWLASVFCSVAMGSLHPTHNIRRSAEFYGMAMNRDSIYRYSLKIHAEVVQWR